MTVRDKTNNSQSSFKIADLEKSVFALGDFFVERSAMPNLKLLKAGDLIDTRQFEKIKKAKHSHFHYVPFINSDYIEEGIALWKALEFSESEEEKKKSRVEILKWFSKVFWQGKEKGSLLDLIHVHEKVFWRFDRSFIESYWNCSTMLLKRSVLLSSLVTPLALASGYVDFKFLSDVCHTSFLIDCSFEQENFSYLISKACEKERQESPAEELELVDAEKYLYLSHPQLSFEKASVQCSQFLNDKTVLSLILNHHEKTTGAGWPNKITEAEVSDLENILISLNQILSYEEWDFTENDGMGYLKNLTSSESNLELGSLPIRRLQGLLHSVFDGEDLEPLAKGA